jgi:hypothetical protein
VGSCTILLGDGNKKRVYTCYIACVMYCDVKTVANMRGTNEFIELSNEC